VSKLEIVQTLQFGNIIDRYKEKGNSMLPLIYSGQPVRLEPIEGVDLKKDDIVFCRVKGNYYMHLITKIQGYQYQISNNHGYVNGWITRNSIFGIVTKIYDK